MFLASSPELEAVSGRFFDRKGVATKSSKVTYDESVAKRLWQVSAELTHLEAKQPR